MSNTKSASISQSRTRIRAVCETAIFVALALVVNTLRLNIMPYGGSVDLILIPLVIICLRWGMGWGFAAGLVFGVIKCLSGEGVSYGWQSMLLDYFVAYSVTGIAGLFRHKTGLTAAAATALAGLCQYAVFVLSGGIIWGMYMPDEFLNMPMTNPWVYSIIYNGVYMVPNIILCAVVVALLSVPLGKYFKGEDLPA